MKHYHLALCLVFKKHTEMVAPATPQKGLMTVRHPKEDFLDPWYVLIERSPASVCS